MAVAVLVAVAGVSDEPDSWTLVSLGDSTTTGAACPDCVPFPTLLGRAIGTRAGRPVSVRNLGVDGSTSSDLLASLSSGRPGAAAVRHADMVTVTIGANDLVPALDGYLAGQRCGSDRIGCFTPMLRTLRVNMAAILDRIGQLSAGRPIAVRVTGYWNVFVDGSVAAATFDAAQRADSVALTVQVNDLIKEVSLSRGMAYVDLLTPFEGPDGTGDPTALLAPDGDHPSQTGHQVIADTIVRAGLAPLGTTG